MQDALTALSSRLASARNIAYEAGAALLARFGRIAHFDVKASPFDLVTEADRYSEALILARLRASWPADAILGEESDGREGAAARREEIVAAEWAWCVDPLDGTTNFVHGQPAFAVSIGLLSFGVPVLGVVHAPARGETFAGGRGVPATRSAHPIRVSEVNELGRALIATGFPAKNRAGQLDGLLAILGRVLGEAHCIRRAGSAALDLCDVACGRLDGFYERGLSPWDVVAGEAILRAAGGRVSDERGDAHDPFGGSILATNGRIHAALRRAVSPAADEC